MRLFSTFVSGFEGVVAELLRRDVPDVRILRLLDGAVDYETASWDKPLPYLNNTFAVCMAMGNGQNKAMFFSCIHWMSVSLPKRPIAM